MKTISHKILPFGLGLFAALPALAIEPPKDDAPPPPSIKTTAAPSNPKIELKPETDPPLLPRASEKERPAPETPIAYVGLITANVPELLAAHIGTKPGEGVIIRELAPGGPAEKAGFAKYDVILRVGGKTIGSAPELSQYIAENQPGDDVSIDFIHEGKASSKTVKLGSRPDNAPRITDPNQLGHLNFDDMPQEQADRIREMIERRLSGQMRGAQELGTPKNRGGGFQFKSDTLFRMMDNNGSIEMKSNDGSKEITVRDRQNNISWSGPWNTEQDKEAPPAEIRERIEKFKFDDGFRKSGFRFRMGPNNEPNNGQ